MFLVHCFRRILPTTTTTTSKRLHTIFKLYIDPIISLYVDTKIDSTVFLLSYEHLCLAGIISQDTTTDISLCFIITNRLAS